MSAGLSLSATLYTAAAGTTTAVQTPVECTVVLPGALIPPGTTLDCLSQGLSLPVSAGSLGLIVIKPSVLGGATLDVANLSITTAITVA